MVVDPVVLVEEVRAFRRRGSSQRATGQFSSCAPDAAYYCEYRFGCATSARRTRFAWTPKGIGPTYESKAARTGFVLAISYPPSAFARSPRARSRRCRRCSRRWAVRRPTPPRLRPPIALGEELRPHIADGPRAGEPGHCARRQRDVRRRAGRAARRSIMPTYPYVTSSSATGRAWPRWVWASARPRFHTVLESRRRTATVPRRRTVPDQPTPTGRCASAATSLARSRAAAPLRLARPAGAAPRHPHFPSRGPRATKLQVPVGARMRPVLRIPRRRPDPG